MTLTDLRPATRRWSGGVIREVLPNGLTLLIQRDDSAPVVAVVTHVKAGFFDEPDRWVGISHVLEHMFFKGTSRRGVGAIARETKSAGGYLNASTTYDQTVYFTVLPSTGLAMGLDIQSDALVNSVIDAGELARELQVIIQEAKRKLDTPGALVQESLNEVMFDRHRIRRWRIGYEKDLAGFTRADLWAYYQSRYVPSRVIVAIVGDIDPDAALALGRRTYEDWPSRPGAIDPSPEEPPRHGVRVRTLRGDVNQAEAIFGWRGVPPLHPDAPALDMAAALLSSGRGSWLYRSLRETGLATTVSAYHYAPSELGVFHIATELDPGRLPVVMAKVGENVARLAMLGPSPEDLDRTRSLYLTRWVRGIETMEGRASALAAAEALGSVALLDKEYDDLAAVTAEQMREVAARYLHPEDVSAAVYLPRERGADLTVEQVERTFAVSQLRHVTSAAPPTLPTPKPRHAKSRLQAEVVHTALPGIDLLVRRKPGVPTVTLGLYAPRLAFDPPEQAGIGALAIRSAIRGAAGMDASRLAFALERLGGSLATAVTVDWLGFATTVGYDRLGEAAALLDRVALEPAFADEDIAAERSLLVEEAMQTADDMFRYPFQLAFMAAFGESGYGLPVLGLPETLRALGAPDVRRWYATGFAAQRPVLIAVGDVVAARASDALAGVFAGRASRDRGPGYLAQAWISEAQRHERLARRDKAQSAVAMAFPGPQRRDPAYYAAEVWAALASGLGGRLFEALRDKRSLAYTVMASAWAKGRSGALLTYIATSPEREEEARAAMLEELEVFTREPVSERELRQSVNYLAGQAEVERQNAGSLLGEILEAWLIGGGLGDLEDPPARFRAVTAEAVMEVAQGGLTRQRRAEGVIRGSGGGK
jgi:zinc protease